MIQFDLSGLDRFITRIEKLRDSLPAKLHTIMQRLGDLGVSIAQVSFSSAQYDGTNDVKCYTEWDGDKKLNIVANGKAVAFIEFGTGIVYVDDHPKAKEMGAIRGSYGYHMGRFPTWHYPVHKGTGSNGVYVQTSKGMRILTEGNPPSYSLYNTAKELRTKIQSIAEEVLNND